jgi:hypothetical protein
MMKLVGGHQVLESQQVPLVADLHHLADQCGGRHEADCQALLARGQTETESDMGLARAAGAQCDDVLSPFDPFATSQFQHLYLVELGDGSRIEAVEAFEDRESGRLDVSLDLAAIPFDHLPFGEPGETPNMVRAIGGTWPDQILERAKAKSIRLHRILTDAEVVAPIG